MKMKPKKRKRLPVFDEDKVKPIKKKKNKK